jgi:hypothetical protein
MTAYSHNFALGPSAQAPIEVTDTNAAKAAAAQAARTLAHAFESPTMTAQSQAFSVNITRAVAVAPLRNWLSDQCRPEPSGR